MYCQMIRVISSPSISTTGFFTLIFAILRGHLLRAGIGNGRRTDEKFGAHALKTPPSQPRRLYSIDFPAVKGASARGPKAASRARGREQDAARTFLTVSIGAALRHGQERAR